MEALFSSCSCSSLVSFFGRYEWHLWFSHALRIEDFGNLFLAQQAFAAGDLDDRFSSGNRFFDDLRRFGVPNVRIKRCCQRNCALRVEIAAVAIDSNSSDALVGE